MIYLVVIILILVLCFYLSRFIAKKMNGIGGGSIGGNKIKVIERVALGQDKGLAICKICTRYYVIGIATESIKILAELDPQHFADDNSSENSNIFKDLLKNSLNTRSKNKPDAQ